MISIIIPTLNEESVLEETLKSLKKMTLKHEIIVSDGRSNDKTLEIAKKHANKIIIYNGEKRQTIAHAKNSGAADAEGEYLVFIDGDVIISSPDDFFKKLLHEFEKDRTITGITVSLKVMDHLATTADKIVFGMVNNTHYLNNNILKIGSASGEFQMIRKDYFRKIGGYNEFLAVAEDNEMFSRLAKHGRTKMVYNLHVLHTGRRAHKVGWIRLLLSWFVNYMSVFVFKKSAYKEWKPIR